MNETILPFVNINLVYLEINLDQKCQIHVNIFTQLNMIK